MKDRLSRMQLAVLQIFVYKVDQGRVQQKAYNYNCIDLYSNLVWWKDVQSNKFQPDPIPVLEIQETMPWDQESPKPAVKQ